MSNPSKVKHPAVKMKAKRAKKLAAALHCCIPATVVKTVEMMRDSGTTYIVNPDINPDTGNGKKWTPDATYRPVRDDRKEYLRNHYKNKRKSKRPWYYLTTGKCYNYETRKKSWGDHTDFFRVPSETKKFADKYVIKRFNRAMYTIGVVRDAVKQWERRNPMPKEEIEGTKNAFYAAEYSDWMNRRADIWNKKLLSIKNRPDSVLTEYLNSIPNTEYKAAA